MIHIKRLIRNVRIVYPNMFMVLTMWGVCCVA